LYSRLGFECQEPMILVHLYWPKVKHYSPHRLFIMSAIVEWSQVSTLFSIPAAELAFIETFLESASLIA